MKLTQYNLFDKQLLPRLREKLLHNNLCDSERQLITVQHYYSTGQFANELRALLFPGNETDRKIVELKLKPKRQPQHFLKLQKLKLRKTLKIWRKLRRLIISLK